MGYLTAIPSHGGLGYSCDMFMGAKNPNFFDGALLRGGFHCLSPATGCGPTPSIGTYGTSKDLARLRCTWNNDRKIIMGTVYHNDNKRKKETKKVKKKTMQFLDGKIVNYG